MNKKDQVFKRPIDSIKGFEFDDEVASVFDDMISRSIPFYDEIHRILLDIIDRTLKAPGGTIYDLGCSTGTTIALIDRHLKKKSCNSISPKYIGVDNSKAMIQKCQEKLKLNKVKDVKLLCTDIQKVSLAPSQLIIMNYTLQFIPSIDRVPLLSNIYQSLEKGGGFLLSEKLMAHNHEIDSFITDLYYDFKRRNGYSHLEISQKREALENILVPETPKKNMEMLNSAGFTKVEMIFRWYNFACYLGIK